MARPSNCKVIKKDLTQQNALDHLQLQGGRTVLLFATEYVND